MHAIIEIRQVQDWAAAIQGFGEFARAERARWRKHLYVGWTVYAVACLAWTAAVCGIGFNLRSLYIVCVNAALGGFALWHLHFSYRQVLASKTMLRDLPKMYRSALRKMLQQRDRELAVMPNATPTPTAAAECQP